MSENNGIFITFEGADGVGKSTQVAFYADLLKSLGHDVLLVREPGGTRIGETARNILLDVNNTELTDESELLLYLVARSQVVNEVINPALKKGKIVLCDRFFDSTLAYQGYGRGMNKGFIERANKFVCGDCIPDLTILFYISQDERQRRVSKREELDRIESVGKLFETRVADGFFKIAESEKERFVLVNTEGKHSQTARLVIEAASKLIPVDCCDDFVKQRLEGLDKEHIHSECES
jgi:dTMP kinase